MAEELATAKNLLSRARQYVADVRGEMKRVTWPGRQEVYGTTVMVILTTFLFAGYFGVCDWIFRFAVQHVLDFFLRGR